MTDALAKYFKLEPEGTPDIEELKRDVPAEEVLQEIESVEKATEES